jgi:hypothetical protein
MKQLMLIALLLSLITIKVNSDREPLKKRLAVSTKAPQYFLTASKSYGANLQLAAILLPLSPKSLSALDHAIETNLNYPVIIYQDASRPKPPPRPP